MGTLIKWYFIIQLGLGALGLAVFLLGFIAHTVFSAPIIAIFIAMGAAIVIFGRLIIRKAFCRYECTAAEKSELEEAKKKDAEARQNNAAAKRRAEQDRDMHAENAAEDIRSRIKAVKEKIAREDSIIAGSVMPAKDRHLEAVDYVIGQLEGLRANTLSEALYQYDDYSDKKHRRNLQYLQDKWDREQREEREREEYWKAQEHRWKMESLEKERLNEVKEANKKLEDMKRGW